MNLINTLFPFLELASALSAGLLAGALLTEANVLVPYWRKMAPKDFLGLHHQMAPLLFRFFAPITIAGTVLPVITWVCTYLINASAVLWWGVSALLGLLMLGIYFSYFKSANESFEKNTITEQDLPAELAKWTYWHKIRTVFAVIATVTALIAIS